MNSISIRTASVALHGIVNKAAASGRHEFTIRDLMRDWCQTGLRNSDLGIALSDASQRRCVKLEVKPEGPTSIVLDKSFGLDPLSAEFGEEQRTLATLRQLRGASPHRREGASADENGFARRIEDANDMAECLQQA